MKWLTFPGLLSLSMLMGCSKPIDEFKAMAQCRLLAAQQGREINCQHCDRCYTDPFRKQVILEETQAAKVIKTWPIK